MIDKALGLGHPDPAETYSSSPHFYEELDIPTDATGTVGPARGRPRPPSVRRATPQRRPPAPAHKSRRRTRGGKPVSSHPEGDKAAPAVRERRKTRRRRRRGRPQAPSPSPPQGGRARPPTSEVPPADGQTRASHPGRPAGRRGDRRGGRRRRRPDLVDQRRQGHDQQARRVAGEDPRTRQGRSAVAAGAVDGAKPEDDDAGGGRRQRGDRKRSRRRRPRSGDRCRCCGATPATSTCAGSPRCTTTPSRSIPTAAAAAR